MRDEVFILFLYSFRLGEIGTIFFLAIQMTSQMKLSVPGFFYFVSILASKSTFQKDTGLFRFLLCLIIVFFKEQVHVTYIIKIVGTVFILVYSIPFSFLNTHVICGISSSSLPILSVVMALLSKIKLYVYAFLHSKTSYNFIISISKELGLVFVNFFYCLKTFDALVEDAYLDHGTTRQLPTTFNSNSMRSYDLVWPRGAIHM